MLSKSIILLSLPLLTLAHPAIPWGRPTQHHSPTFGTPIPKGEDGYMRDPHSGLEWGPEGNIGVRHRDHDQIVEAMDSIQAENDAHNKVIVEAEAPERKKGNSKVFNDMFRISEGNSVALFNGVPVDRNTGHAIKITNENENPGSMNKGSMKSVSAEDTATATPPSMLHKRGLRNKLGLDFLQAPSTEDATRNAQKAFADGSIGRMNIPGNQPQGPPPPPGGPPPHPMMAKFPIAQQGGPVPQQTFQQKPPQVMPPQGQQPQQKPPAPQQPQQKAPAPPAGAPKPQQQGAPPQGNPAGPPKNFSTSTATTGKPKSKEEKKQQKAEGKDLSNQIEEAKKVHGNKWLIQNGALRKLEPGERPTRKAMEVVGGQMDDESKLSQKWREDHGGNLMKRSIGNKLGLGMFDFRSPNKSKSLAHQGQSGQSQSLDPLDRQINQMKQSEDDQDVDDPQQPDSYDDQEDVGDDEQQDLIPEHHNNYKPKPKANTSPSPSHPRQQPPRQQPQRQQPPRQQQTDTDNTEESEPQVDEFDSDSDSDSDSEPEPLTMDRLSNAKSFAILNGVAVEVDGNPVSAGKKMKKPRPAFPRFRDRESASTTSSYDGTWNEFSYHPNEPNYSKLQKRSALPNPDPLPEASPNPGKKVPGVNPFSRNPLSAKRNQQNGGNGGAKTKKETQGEITSKNVNGQEKVVRTPRSSSEDTVRVYGGGNYRKCNGRDCGVPGQLGCPKLPGGVNEPAGKRGVAGIF